MSEEHMNSEIREMLNGNGISEEGERSEHREFVWINVLIFAVAGAIIALAHFFG